MNRDLWTNVRMMVCGVQNQDVEPPTIATEPGLHKIVKTVAKRRQSGIRKTTDAR